MTETKLARIVRRLYARASLAGLALLAASAQAQTDAVPSTAVQPAEAAPMQRVEITGSSIKRLATEAALPITTLRAADFAKQGLTTAQDVLNTIPMNQTQTVGSSSVGSGTGGRATADLRGLGSDKTLVLLNGRRLANHPYFADTVDLNIIPVAALERVEVLRDGASAIYGSDAIGGVINFITKRSVKDSALAVEAYQPTHAGGGGEQRLNLSSGWGDLGRDGYSLFGVIDWHQQSALKASARGFSGTGVRPERGMNEFSYTTFPANFFAESGVYGNPYHDAGCGQPATRPAADEPLCQFDYTQFVDNIPKTQQFSVMGKFNKQLGPDHLASIEYLHSRSTNESRVAPPPLSGIGVILTADSPFYPGKGSVPAFAGLTGEPLDVNWRPLETGRRVNFDESLSDRVVASLEGSLGGWDYNSGVSYSLGRASSKFVGGYVVDQRIIDGVGSGILNPFGAQTPAGAAFLDDSLLLGEYLHARIASSAIDARASRDLMTLPGGALGFALGAEGRHDKAQYFVNRERASQASSSGYADAQDQRGSRTIWALFTELNAPLYKDLELNLAARYDHYSDSGGSFNPKVALRYQPSAQWLLRGSFNKGFRAPTLFDLYGPQSTTNTSDSYDDPMLCPDGSPVAGANPNIVCGQQQQIRGGGNPDLEPERSRTWTVGAVFEPIPSLTLSLDYWNIKLKNQISSLPEQTIFGDFAKYRDLFVYDPSGTRLTHVLALTSNLGEVRTRGLDVSLFYRLPSHPWGKLSASVDGTWVNQYEYQNERGGPFTQNAGRYADAAPVFRWRHNLVLTWIGGDWNVSLANRYNAHYTDQNTAVEPEFFNKVRHYSTWSLSTTYTGFRQMELTAGLKNMFDKDPPFTNQITNFQLGYDPRYTDPLGRTLFVRGTLKF